MFRHNLNSWEFNKYYNEEGGGSDSTVPDGSSVEDDIKFLGEDDETPEEEPEVLDLKTPAKDKDDETEPDEIEELAEELEEPDDEKLELTTPVRRRDILKKYPELFKDFPYLEKAYYREQQFTEILPTIDDAKVAVQKSQTLDRFEQELIGGNIENIFKAVYQENKNSFNKIVDELLPTLARVDRQAYDHTVGNIIKHTIISMVKEAQRSNSEPLKGAAAILNQYVFGNSEFENPKKLATEEPVKKDDELSQREQEFNRRQFEAARDGLNNRVSNSLRATIEANIDPKNSMTDYVKRNAMREVQENLDSLIGSDKRFIQILDRLWENAFKSGLSKDATDRIRSAYLSKAKVLLPQVIKKARIEALRGMGKRVNDSTDTDIEDIKTTSTTKTKPQSQVKSGNKVPRGMSTLEFLNQD